MDVSWDTADLAGNPKKPEDLQYEYARRALTRGMLLERTLGTNPFKFGMVSGTDTHMALSTGAEENNWLGKFPNSEPHKGRWNEVYKKEANYLRKDWTLSAAGLTGVWATANTREAIWDAFKRKEVYASTGPRISVRMFAGWNFTDADAKGDVATTGYAHGVPMGGDLSAAAAGKVPTVLFAAMKDPDGANLDRVQIVKGWVDASGALKEKIYDVKWSGDRKRGADGRLAPVGNTVNESTATYSNSIGAAQLIGTFRDPDFDPARPAYYYVRAIEIPTPRWTLYDAVRFGEKMSPEVPTVVQERAVTSPVWYTPHR